MQFFGKPPPSPPRSPPSHNRSTCLMWASLRLLCQCGTFTATRSRWMRAASSP
jgi:hypothetical protein